MTRICLYQTSARLRQAFASQVQRSSEFAAQGLSNSVWAFATLQLPLALDVVATKAASMAFTSQGLTNMAWALATLAQCHVPLFRMAATATAMHMPFRELAMMAWGSATVKMQLEELRRGWR